MRRSKPEAFVINDALLKRIAFLSSYKSRDYLLSYQMDRNSGKCVACVLEHDRL
jgi:hypothetical protein